MSGKKGGKYLTALKDDAAKDAAATGKGECYFLPGEVDLEMTGVAGSERDGRSSGASASVEEESPVARKGSDQPDEESEKMGSDEEKKSGANEHYFHDLYPTVCARKFGNVV